MKVTTASGEKRIALADICAINARPAGTPCRSSHDVLAGEPAKTPAGEGPSGYDDIAAIEAMSLAERRAYWEGSWPLHPLLRLPERLPPVRLQRNRALPRRAIRTG